MDTNNSIINNILIDRSIDPISHDFFQRQGALFWLSRDINFENDKASYDSLPSEQKHILDKIICFFLIGDGEVIENITRNFISNADNTCQKNFYMLQSAIEFVHADVYQQFAEKLKGITEYQKFITKISTYTSVMNKLDFMQKYIEEDVKKELRHVAYACAEGVFFCTLFTVIFWFKTQGKMDSFISANERIMKDEIIHLEYQCECFRRCISHLSNSDRQEVLKQARLVVDEAVNVEKLFVDDLLPHPIAELNSKTLKGHIHIFANKVLQEIGSTDLYTVEHEYEWMKNLSLEVKGNFFEVEITQYQKPKMVNDSNFNPYDNDFDF